MVQSQPSTHGDETVSRRYRYTSVPAPGSDRPDDGCAVRQPVVEVRLHSAGDAFSLAALLLVRIFPICSLVAPCPGGPRLQFRALGAMPSFHHGLLASVGHHDAVPPLRLDLAHRPVGGLQQFLGRGRHGGQCGHADRGRQPDVEPVAGQKCVRSCADRSRRSPCERTSTITSCRARCRPKITWNLRRRADRSSGCDRTSCRSVSSGEIGALR